MFLQRADPDLVAMAGAKDNHHLATNASANTDSSGLTAVKVK